MLERQRAALQRMYQDQFHMDSDHQLLWQSDDHHHSHSHSHSQPRRRRSCSAASATHNTAPPIHQCNSTTSFPNKRKPEFDIEEETEEVAAEEKSDITTKTERETSANTSSKESLKASEVEKPDYIHVRARRGQATDSHSLAERARREKISKKMKCLQDLVPGCNKVTGKAGMLDEIINYVQSLQKQVEFLSMKLAAVNPRLDFSIDNLFAKEIPAYLASLPAQMEATASPPCFQYNPMQLGVQVAMDQSHQIASPKPAGSSSLPIPEVFHDSSCISQLQQLSGWESSDWQNLFSAGFQ